MVYVSFFRTILIRYQVGKGYLNTIEHIKVALSDPMDSNFGRETADQLAISFQASCLLQYGDPLVAEAFLATRWTQLGLTTQSLGSATSSLPESGLEISWESCSKAADDDQGLMLLKYGFVWKCWVNIPNEIAIFHRDNDQQKPLGTMGYTTFSDTPICWNSNTCKFCPMAWNPKKPHAWSMRQLKIFVRS